MNENISLTLFCDEQILIKRVAKILIVGELV